MKTTYTMKTLKTLTAMLLIVAFAAAPMTGSAAEKKDATAKPYPFDTCVVSGEKLGEMGKAYAFTHDGQEVKLCCKDCLKKFNAAPAKYLKQIADVKMYPLDTYVVSGEKLGEMGNSYVFTHDGQVVKLCCKDCLKKFNASPATYLKKIADAKASKAGS